MVVPVMAAFRRPTVFFQARRYAQDKVRVIVTRDMKLSTCNADDIILEQPRLERVQVDWEPQGGRLKGVTKDGVPMMICAPKGVPKYCDFGLNRECEIKEKSESES
jgi:hypothetical protein